MVIAQASSPSSSLEYSRNIRAMHLCESATKQRHTGKRAQLAATPTARSPTQRPGPVSTGQSRSRAGNTRGLHPDLIASTHRYRHLCIDQEIDWQEVRQEAQLDLDMDPRCSRTLQPRAAAQSDPRTRTADRQQQYQQTTILLRLIGYSYGLSVFGTVDYTVTRYLLFHLG